MSKPKLVLYPPVISTFTKGTQTPRNSDLESWNRRYLSNPNRTAEQVDKHNKQLSLVASKQTKYAMGHPGGQNPRHAEEMKQTLADERKARINDVYEKPKNKWGEGYKEAHSQLSDLPDEKRTKVTLKSVRAHRATNTPVGSPIPLPQMHSDYFEDHDAEDVRHIPLKHINLTPPHTGGAVSAEANMALTQQGMGAKRHAIDVRQGKGGKYEIIDGHSTAHVAHMNGWSTIPARVHETEMVKSAAGKPIRTSLGRQLQRRMAFYKAVSMPVNPHGPLPPDHPSSRTRAAGGDGMFTGKEISLGRPVDLKQNSNDFETNNRNAKAAKVDYDEMLHHVATHLGFRHTTDGPSIENLNAGAATGGMTLTAPLKKQEKVEMRANGKKAHADGTPGYDNIKDHVRGSVVVRHRADLPHVMDALRKHMGDKFEIAAKPKDRYAEPTQEGYSDVSLALRHKPTGHIGELQLSTFDMIHAKEHGEPGKETPEHAGHHYYDVTEKIKDKEDKGEATPQELGKRDDTNAQARHLYSGALESESKQEPALEKHPAARFEHGHAIARSYAAVQAQGPLMDRSGRKYNKPFGGKLPV